MKEIDIQLFWLNHATQLEQLFTSNGSSIKVIHPGMINLNQGPDFLHATIQIDDTSWFGSVEVHLKTSGWLRHRHNTDRNYKNVILHVVWEDDVHSFDHCPILILSTIFKAGSIKYKLDKGETERVHQLHNQLSLDELSEYGLKRIERKANEILVDLRLFHGNWQFITVRKLIYTFGIPLNGDVFQQMIDAIFPIFNTQHFFKQENIKSLFFGMSCMYTKMSKEDIIRYDQLRNDLLLKPVQINFIRFRIRPNNFPEKRIEEFVKFIYKFPFIFRALIESGIEYSDFFTLMRDELGRDQFNKFVINVFVPILIAYSTYSGNILIRKRALLWLSHLPAETNRITKQFTFVNKPSLNALHTQGMLEYISGLSFPIPN